MSSNAIIIPFPQRKDEAAELLDRVDRYTGNTAEHIDDVLSEVRAAIGEALFLHIQPVLAEVMWEFAKECKLVGAAMGLQRERAKQIEIKTDKKITPIVCKR